MTQATFAFTGTRREKKRGHVRRSSVLTAQAEAPQLRGRAETVYRWLREFLSYGEYPTSAELAKFTVQYGWGSMNWDQRLLFARRGLSDLQTKNVVERVPAGDRICRISGRTACTWRVTQR